MAFEQTIKRQHCWCFAGGEYKQGQVIRGERLVQLDQHVDVGYPYLVLVYFE